MLIHKYEIPVTGLVVMPSEHKILCVKAQRNQLCVWAEVNPESETVGVQFNIGMTGGDAPMGRYLGTALLNNDSLVLHVYLEE